MLLLPPVHAKPLLRLPYFYSAQHFNTPYLYKSWLCPYRCQLYTRCSGPPSDVPTINGENSLRGLPAHPVSIVDHPNPEVGDDSLVPSARAIAEAIRRASHASPVQFVQRTEKDVKNVSSRPSHDFLRLCLEQMDLFRMIVDRDAIMSVYVRPAGSYVMDQIELHQIAFYPGVDHNEITSTVILIGNFGVPAGLRAAEAYLSNLQVISLPESGATVLPMVKHPFVVGFVVAELPVIETETCTDDEDTEPDSLFGSSSLEAYGLPRSEKRIWEIPNFKKELTKIYHQLTVEQSSRAIAIIRSLAMAYVMDQKALLLQQSSWQNNVRMSHLVEQIRVPLSNIRTLAKMLSNQMRKSEISYDIVEDLLMQGDHMKETLQQLQDAVYLTKANIVRYNEETLKKVHASDHDHSEIMKSLSSNYSSRVQDIAQKVDHICTWGSEMRDVQMPMPPLALAPRQLNIRPCNVFFILADLVGAVSPLVQKQKRLIKFTEHSQNLQVAVEESALRQVLSNLIEGALLRTHIGGGVEIVATGAPGGGVLIMIDDDGPDMHYMVLDLM